MSKSTSMYHLYEHQGLYSLKDRPQLRFSIQNVTDESRSWERLGIFEYELCFIAIWILGSQRCSYVTLKMLLLLTESWVDTCQATMYVFVGQTITWPGDEVPRLFLASRSKHMIILRAGSRFAPSQWETALLSNDVYHWLGASLESAQILL